MTNKNKFQKFALVLYIIFVIILFVLFSSVLIKTAQRGDSLSSTGDFSRDGVMDYETTEQNDTSEQDTEGSYELIQGVNGQYEYCALPGFVDSKNEEKTERNAGYLVVSHSGGGMLRQGTRKGIRRTPANRGMRAHWVVKGLDISEDVCHGMCP